MKLYFYIFFLVYINTPNLFGQEEYTNCLYKFNGFDKKIRKQRIETKSKPLIEYLGRKKSNRLNPNSIPNINVSMSKIGSSHFLHFDILVNQYANRNAYILEKSKLTLRFITGEKIILLAIDQALEQKKTNETSRLLPIYHIPDDELEIIKNKDLNLITIAWTTGNQSYETYQLDVLRHLYSCIN